MTAKVRALPVAPRGDALTETLVDLTPRVRAWLFRLLGPRFELDDALQDALFELARALPRFDRRARLETRPGSPVEERARALELELLRGLGRDSQGRLDEYRRRFELAPAEARPDPR